jgi:GTP cyclohydrolase I
MHTCMVMRGVQKINSKTVTSCMMGTFREDPKTRCQFYKALFFVIDQGTLTEGKGSAQMTSSLR